jgi:hypothetical protein
MSNHLEGAMTTIAQWSFTGSGAEFVPSARVTLRNTKENKSLRFGERENGIELVWDNAATLGNVRVERQSGGASAIAYATPVALRFDTGGYLRYANRSTGINLDWSATPRFEWEITGGPPGTPVRLNRPAALLNSTHGDHLIYDERPEGINLRWYADLDISKVVQGQPSGNWVAFGGYPPLPIPRSLRAPGREAAQIQITGEARKVALFHGSSDDELDWHIYVSISPADRRALANHLREHARGGAGIDEEDFDQPYCELMVLDGWRNPTFDEFFFSADVTRAFDLLAPAWDLSERAGNNQGDDLRLTNGSRLTQSGARVSLQGPFVNDAAHGFRPEIHPLDSIAYALTADGAPIAVSADDPRWPESRLTWRVAVFTNSTFHRIHNADYLEQDRTITWLLELPSADRRVSSPPGPGRPPGQGQIDLNQTSVTVIEPGFTNRGAGAEDLDGRRPTAGSTYARYRVAAAEHALTPRNSAGRRFLRVVVRMDEPDRWGGMFLAEYRIRTGPPVVKKAVDE